MASQKRRPQPCGDCGASESVKAGRFDTLRFNPPNLKKQVAHRGRAKFARATVFEVFGYRAARAIDYDRFRDRKPSQSPRPSPALVRWRAAS